MATLPEDAVRHLEAQPVRHERRAENVRTVARLVPDAGPETMPMPAPYIPMDADGDPLSHAMADQCQRYSREGCADTSDFPRVPRKRRMPEGGLIACLLPITLLLAIAAAVFLIKR